MQVLQYFTKKKPQETIQAIQFAPSIQISPTSTLFVEVMPNNPHTASDIVINSYQSKTNRTNLQTRIQWRRFKILTESQHTNTHLPFITGNAYRCEPTDLGYYIQAKIISYDVACNGTAEVTIGPIRLDPTVKQLIEGALYSRSLRSHVKIIDKISTRSADMILTDRIIRIIDEISNKQLQMTYDMFEPKIQVNPKDPTKIFLRFQKDNNNNVRQWLDSIFGSEDNFDTQSRKSFTSQGSGSSKSKIFRGANCQNKVQLQFLTRHSRDQFIFSLRAFVYKQQMKNTAVLESIENVLQMKTPADVHKFFQYMSLKNQIYRLAQLARELQIDRDNKLKDLHEVEQTITETTTAYIQLLEKKGREVGIDFNQTYSQVSIRRDEIFGRKHMRELQMQNQNLKERVKYLVQQNQFKAYLQNKNNESQLFNQTSNPFAKKVSSDSYYNPSMINEKQEELPRPSVAELTKSYANLFQQNQKLKSQKRAYMANMGNMSTSKDDMMNLLESLHQEDEDPAVLVKKLKAQNKNLKKKLQQIMSEYAENKNKSQTGIKLNQSVAYQQQQQSMVTDKKEKSYLGTPNIEKSAVQNSRQEGSFYSVNQSNINESMTSQAGILLLENKIRQIDVTNKKILAQNDRLRKQRNQYKTLCEQLKKGGNVSISQNALQHKSVFSNSNYFDPEGLKQQNQNLINEKNSLLKKIESLTREAGKSGDGLIEKKCQQLTKQNNYLRQQNESLKQKIDALRSSKSPQNSFTQNYRENDKLKKINSQLLEQIKMLKLQLQGKNDPLNSTRILELQNQVNFLKNTGQGNESIQKATQQLLSQISKLQKQIQKLNRQNSDKEAKLASQANVIQRLMNSQDQGHSISGKDKSYSQTRNDSESNQKLKKKIRQLQQQIVLMRRSADALNRSQDMSRDMLNYTEEQIQVMRKQKQMILTQNEKLSRMCQKYAKDAKEALKQVNKWKQQAFDLMKAQSPQDVSIS